MLKPRNVTSNATGAVPATKQTDPKMFPPYEFREYPKVMMRKVTKEDLEDWLSVNFTADERGNKSYRGGRPVLGQLTPIMVDGEPVIVQDEDEEAAFRGEHPEVHQHIVVNSEKVAELMDENAELRRKLDAFEADDGAKVNIGSLVKEPVTELPATLKTDTKPKK